MYKNNYVHRTSRAPYAKPKRSRKSGEKFIDPSRFIKAAAPREDKEEYQSHNQFADFDMHPQLKQNLIAKGYASPSEIQDKTIALGLAGKNVIGIANTGTGKTAAFSLPILNRLMQEKGSRAIIIAPTRELAMQIEEQCRLLARGSGLLGVLLIGGAPMGPQLKTLREQPEIVIGTPGRIKDHLGQKSLNLSRFNMVVLDEVDRMLDMGFINDVRMILSELPTQHQAFFFSATLSPQIRSLIDTFTENPEVIDVKQGETSENVHQDIVTYSGKTEKVEALHDALIADGVGKTLVFGKTKYGVERLGKELKARGFKADSLHGGKTQGQRKRALDSFRDGHIQILVATDVAARGIDVKDITHVINYDTPQTYEDYVHRIGRAGRAGKAGQALTFVEKP